MTPGGWGLGAWGLSPWGGIGLGFAETTIVSIYAITTNDVIVNASAPLLQRSPVLAGDSLNPATWQIVRLDTNEVIPVVMATANSPTQMDLHTLFPLPPTTVQLQLNAPTLLDALGNPVDPLGTFTGMTEFAYATPAQTAVTMTTAPNDLLNRQLPASTNTATGTPLGTPGSLSGTFVISGGDYVNQTGLDLYRKLIIRRLTTTPGDFLHIPGYGCGISAKKIYPAGDLVKLQATIKQQMMQESWIQTVQVSVSQSSSVLTVSVTATVASTGAQVNVSVPFPMGGSS